YTLDDNQKMPVKIPAGARSQSIPGPGEQPQSFETSDDLDAHTEWNDLQVRRTRPPNVTMNNVLTIDHITVSGISTNLRKGDTLLFTFGKDSEAGFVRTVADIESEFENKRTTVRLNPLPALLVAALEPLKAFVKAAAGIITSASLEAERRLFEEAE